MSMSLKPLGNRVVVERIAQEVGNAGGIVLPETAKEKPQKGTVLSVGPASAMMKGTYSHGCRQGDTVLFAKYAGHRNQETMARNAQPARKRFISYRRRQIIHYSKE
jgi:chaperonin GroES